MWSIMKYVIHLRETPDASARARSSISSPPLHPLARCRILLIETFKSIQIASAYVNFARRGSVASFR
jgi:hypothetical protein